MENPSMSKCIRVVLTRPDLSVIPFWDAGAEFLDSINEASRAWNTAFPGNPTYINNNNMSELTMIVDHVITNDADLEAHRDAMMALIPWWRNAANASAIDDYATVNGLTYTVNELPAEANYGSWTNITNL